MSKTMRHRMCWALWVLALSALCLSGCGNRQADKGAQTQVPVLDGTAGFVGKAYMRVTSDAIPGEVRTCTGSMICSVQNVFFYKGEQMDEETLAVWAEEYDQIEVKSVVWNQEIMEQGVSEPVRIGETSGYTLDAVCGKENDIWLTQMGPETYLGLGNEYFLVRINRNGREAFRVKLDNYPSRLAVDGEGNAAVQTLDGLFYYNAKGKRRGKTILSEMLLALCGDGEEGFYLIETGVGGTDLWRVHDNKEEVLELEYADFYGLAPAGAGNVLAWNGTKLYRYSCENGTARELCSWADAGVYPGDIEECLMDDRGRVRMITKESSGDYLITLEQDEDGGQTKNVVTLGAWHPSGDLMRKVVTFNRENDQYCITVLDYADRIDGRSSAEERRAAKERMTLDLLSGKGPDLIAASYDVDLKALADQGILVDLNPYLEGSQKISREDFFEEVLLSATIGDVLAYLPENFYINTVIGKADTFGERTGWTIDDMLQIAKDHPDAYLFAPNDYGRNRGLPSAILRVAVACNQQFFSDSQSSAVTEALCSLLELAKKEYENTQQITSENLPEAYRNGSVLVAELSIMDFKDLHSLKRSYFGQEPVRIIGYPTADGTGGHILYSGGGIGMLSSCEKKEGAFAFLEYYATYLEEEPQVGFSANRKVFEEQMRKALEYSDIILPEGTSTDYVREDIIRIQEIIKEAVGDYCLTDDEILKIVNEEVQNLYTGNKTAEAVSDTIQKRVRLYINENSRWD